MSLSRKMIAFDLCQSALKEHYSSTNPKQAYADIKTYFLSNDFMHRQGSVYISKKAMSPKSFFNVIIKMKENMPWIERCASKIDYGNVGKQYDLLDFLNNTYTIESASFDSEIMEFHSMCEKMKSKDLNENNVKINNGKI